MKRLLSKKLSAGGTEESVNPMDGVANLADVMLVLAVGIMLALVMNFNLDIGTLAYTNEEDQPASIDTENALPIESDDIQEADDAAQQVDGEGMAKLGTVYYDEATGQYYIVHDQVN